mmetsp:Transcript_10730/g.30467  ORF Transcript_10730/g.30467 Transcript_10730/m.30467 type:complete len:289 (-) Transcript_10730:749-1615(-)
MAFREAPFAASIRGLIPAAVGEEADMHSLTSAPSLSMRYDTMMWLSLKAANPRGVRPSLSCRPAQFSFCPCALDVIISSPFSANDGTLDLQIARRGLAEGSSTFVTSLSSRLMMSLRMEMSDVSEECVALERHRESGSSPWAFGTAACSGFMFSSSFTTLSWWAVIARRSGVSPFTSPTGRVTSGPPSALSTFCLAMRWTMVTAASWLPPWRSSFISARWKGQMPSLLAANRDSSGLSTLLIRSFTTSPWPRMPARCSGVFFCLSGWKAGMPFPIRSWQMLCLPLAAA